MHAYIRRPRNKTYMVEHQFREANFAADFLAREGERGRTEVYDSIQRGPRLLKGIDLLHLPLVLLQNKKLGDDVLDESVRLLDACNETREILLQTREHAQELRSALRRKCGESNIKDVVSIHVIFRIGSYHLQNRQLLSTPLIFSPTMPQSGIQPPCADHPRRRQQRLTHDPSVHLRFVCLDPPEASTRCLHPAGRLKKSIAAQICIQRSPAASASSFDEDSAFALSVSSGLRPTSVSQQWASSHIRQSIVGLIPHPSVSGGPHIHQLVDDISSGPHIHQSVDDISSGPHISQSMILAVGPTSVSQSMTSAVGPTSVSQSMTSTVGPTSIGQSMTSAVGPTSVSQSATSAVGPHIRQSVDDISSGPHISIV
ncbi:hypothetical protein ACLOJK_017566 [Asimina triloba]